MTTAAQVTSAVNAFSQMAAERACAVDALVVDVDGTDPVERLWSPDERRDRGQHYPAIPHRGERPEIGS